MTVQITCSYDVQVSSGDGLTAQGSMYLIVWGVDVDSDDDNYISNTVPGTSLNGLSIERTTSVKWSN